MNPEEMERRILELEQVIQDLRASSTIPFDIREAFSNGLNVSTGFINVLNSVEPTELTISGGVVTAGFSYHTIDTESDAGTDDLNTINGGTDGDLLFLQSVAGTRDPTLKDGVGNLVLSGDFTLTSADDLIFLIHIGGTWYEISRSNNG